MFEVNQNPFSIYDFLGYLIPGSFFLSFMHVIPSNCYFEMLYFKAYSCSYSQIGNINWLHIVLFVIFSYISGHFLSYLSSMTIEKYSIWTIGYPSNYLFSDNNKKIKFRKKNKVWYLYFQLYFFPKKDKHKSKWYKFSVFLIRFGLLIFLIPITTPLLILVSVFRLNGALQKSVEDKLANIIEIKSTIKLKELTKQKRLKISESGECFRILYHFSIEKFPVHRLKMQNYVALYGFCRSLSLILVFLFWWFLYQHFNKICFDKSLFFCGLINLSFAAFIFYLAFNKFFRKFTLECLMAIASSEKKL